MPKTYNHFFQRSFFWERCWSRRPLLRSDPDISPRPMVPVLQFFHGLAGFRVLSLLIWLITVVIGVSSPTLQGYHGFPKGNSPTPGHQATGSLRLLVVLRVSLVLDLCGTGHRERRGAETAALGRHLELRPNLHRF